MLNEKEENLRGALFAHSGKTNNSPQRKGYVIVDNIKYWVSSWDKKGGTTGETFWTLQLTKSENQ